MSNRTIMADGWTRVKDGGILRGRPSYEKNGFYIAQDYDDPEEGSKMTWFVHNESGMVSAHETLRDAKASVGGGPA